MLNKQYRFLLGLLFFLAFVGNCFAQQLNIAVASNALSAVKVISLAFEKKTGHTVLISGGSTGKLYAQIVNGAPFDIFFAANQREPQRLEQAHLIVPHSRFTYALGRLVAWSSEGSLLKSRNIKDALSSKAVSRIAIANPKIAPYGLAAQQALQKVGLWKSLQAKIIRGENVSQTYQFARTNNAQIGFVAMSQILEGTNKIKGSYWEVPKDLYTPITQQAVLLLRSQRKTVAAEFSDFMKSHEVREILTRQFGYGIETL